MALTKNQIETIISRQYNDIAEEKRYWRNMFIMALLSNPDVTTSQCGSNVAVSKANRMIEELYDE